MTALSLDDVSNKNLLLRAKLMDSINQELSDRGIKQTEAGRLLGVRQGDISVIHNKKSEMMRLDKLVNIANQLGLNVSINVG